MPSFFFLGASDSPQVLEKLDSLEKAISNLSFRILALEKRIISLEEKIFLEATRLEKHPGKIPESFEQPSDNFSIGNVTCETHYNDTVFKGDVTNNTNKDFRYSLFKITVYDKNGSVVSSNDFYILNIDRGTTRAFEATIHSVKKEEFERYEITFTKGS
jgi:lipopolysaccharide export LptBFGC system permease protein LptF